MSTPTFEQLRLPLALILIIVAAFVLLPRGNTDSGTASSIAPESPGVAAGRPGGEVTATNPPPSATPVPTATEAPTPRPTAEESDEPTAEPVADDGFTAQVLACRSISGSQCNGQLGTLPGNAASFTALVVFGAANAGDSIQVVMSGPAGTVAGGPYTLGGSGDGYYYATFNVGGMPGGEYSLTATRNGAPVASTTFRRGG